MVLGVLKFVWKLNRVTPMPTEAPMDMVSVSLYATAGAARTMRRKKAFLPMKLNGSPL